ncbi:MAG TPA: DUF3617 domain-containing protein [Burkholderiaceae bacterium]|nr:DUF3617 domain-containing protein [Burkholderiaceae bacterium]
MRFILSFLLLGAALSFGASQAQAADRMAPGLWEMTAQSDALKGLPVIPPEQLAKLRALGIQIPQIANGSATTHTCITPEMARRADMAPAAGASKMGCSAHNVRFDGNRFSADLVCDNDRAKGRGKVSGTFSGNKAFTADIQFTGTVQGVPVNQQGTASGRWLGNDCGSVKPLNLPPEPRQGK